MKPFPRSSLKLLRYLIFVTLFFYLAGIQVALAQKSRPPAPELAGGTAWFNVSEPLTIPDLKGKVVLLDFWTYCCINCMHIIPDLKKLETKYSKELVVIGVHSAKFQNEREAENIRQAILRYGIEHPVINDSNFAIWQAYGARAWPTLVLIDPEGNIVGSDSGEGHFDILDKLIGQLVSEYRSKNLIDEKSVALSLEKYKRLSGMLSFPGKVLADEASNRLFIADSNHNRIVITTLDGVVIDIIGNGQSGRQDGTFKEAGFNRPQGMSLNGDYLYVADTENHLIRRIDLKAKVIKTIAGTGKQAEFMASGGMGISSPINSPWDLVFLEGKLYIAMAGAHQIWVMDLETNVFQPFAGSGREGRIDGLLDKSTLAQPSGIAVSGTRLYFADSEVSAIRYVDTKENRVKTIVGQDLFVFGDVDGKGEEVRLQHPLGVSSYDGLVYVADTYNHKIKIVNPVDNTCSTFAGDGQPGFIDGKEPRFYEPGGLSFANNKLYVADTNNHAIRAVDMKTKEVSTLQIKGLKTEVSEDMSQSAIPSFARSVELPLKTLKADSGVQLTLNINLPNGYHLNPDTTLICRIDAGEGIYFERGNQDIRIEKPVLPVRFILRSGSESKEADLKVSVSFYYCREDNQGACFIDAVIWKQPIKIEKDAGDTAVAMDYSVKLP
ncbi:MAG TPA: thioredoxin-like domain-containing protein [Candidatus Wujingus californicus]|uniref:thioredoxin-like domain-containing protein n=1 Tax=Candidatus Wujingus californicus TaxID=3367618 RepID=UPI001DB936E8|nr:redoxin domain-containing protein [Planctomycetota bacterium]MDO8131745.1 thioredoxin-like domain-containing protein [Candidatus Brocadiales bacterium]